jgi:hypothetical protein
VAFPNRLTTLERRASDLEEAEKLNMFSNSTERSFHLVVNKMRAGSIYRTEDELLDW